MGRTPRSCSEHTGAIMSSAGRLLKGWRNDISVGDYAQVIAHTLVEIISAGPTVALHNMPNEESKRKANPGTQRAMSKLYFFTPSMGGSGSSRWWWSRFNFSPVDETGS